jgi:hypothetical protein
MIFDTSMHSGYNRFGAEEEICPFTIVGLLLI